MNYRGTGWRLPTIDELKTVLDENSKLDKSFRKRLNNDERGYYWSSTLKSDDNNKVIGLNLTTGHFIYGEKRYNISDWFSTEGDSYYVRCVREK